MAWQCRQLFLMEAERFIRNREHCRMDDLPSGAAAEFPVMAGLVPAIHVLLPYATKDEDARHI
jgi:hypothetical protein